MMDIQLKPYHGSIILALLLMLPFSLYAVHDTGEQTYNVASTLKKADAEDEGLILVETEGGSPLFGYFGVMSDVYRLPISNKFSLSAQTFSTISDNVLQTSYMTSSDMALRIPYSRGISVLPEFGLNGQHWLYFRVGVVWSGLTQAQNKQGNTLIGETPDYRLGLGYRVGIGPQTYLSAEYMRVLDDDSLRPGSLVQVDMPFDEVVVLRLHHKLG